MKIVVIGKNGQLGRYLQQVLGERAIYLSRDELDMSDVGQVYERIHSFAADVIINASAYTDTKMAEIQQGLAYAVNAAAVGELARAAADCDAWLIHVSTDYVFDGQSDTPYTENDMVAPQNIYGASKLLGEQLVQTLSPRHVVLRTSWVFSEFGHNFVKTIAQLALEKESLDIVADQRGCPTFAGHLAQVIGHIVQQLDNENVSSGVWHYADAEPCTWHDFGSAVVEALRQRGEPVRVEKIHAVDSTQWPSPIIRPQNGVLDCHAIMSDFGVTQKSWRDGLHYVISALSSEKV